MKPAGTAALKKAGGPAKNPPVKTTGTKAAPRGNAIVRVPRQDDMREYEVRDAMRTLMRAEEIRGNKKLVGEVKRMAADDAKKLAKVC